MKQSQQNTASEQPWPAVEGNLTIKQDNLLAELKAVPVVDAIMARLKAPFGRLVPTQGSSATGEPLTAQEQKLYQIQRTNTLLAIKECTRLTGEIIEHRQALKALLAAARNPLSANERSYCISAIKAVREHIKELREGYSAIAQRDPEAFMVVHSREFRRYARQLNSGAIAKLPFVQGKIQEAVNIIRATQGVIIYGPTGSGKTEIARIIAVEVSGKSPLMISGHRDVSSREFRGHDKLKSSGRIPAIEIPDHIEAAKKEYQEKNPHATQVQLKDAFKQITERFIHENSVTESEFVLGYAYKAAEEGRALIIDEFNLIQTSVIAGLNDLMTKKPGQLVDVPENGHKPFPVAPGFCIIMTGNINTGQGAEYLDRYEIDPSTVNRFLPVHYGFLPQTTEGAVADAKPEQKQLYQMMLSTLRSNRPSAGSPQLSTRLEDRAIIAQLPGGEASLDKLWKLAKLAAITQLALDGKANRDSAYAHRINGVAFDAEVKHALTPRVLVNLLLQWKNNAFEYELDHYVFKALHDAALTEREKDYFYRQGQMQGFFRSPGWRTIIDEGKERLYGDVTSPMNENDLPVVAIPGRVLIEQIHGPAPIRTVWPGDKPEQTPTAKSQADAAEIVAAMHVGKETLEGLKNDMLLLALDEISPS